ncbi:MAG TPA: OB-fold nucleic acid binding domain-containing protein [Anaerolineae bacterium]|nr:OB-fold nucleic acid binding domain-containing protein [Anaerolineae bacterium]
MKRTYAADIKPDDQVTGVFRVLEARLAPYRDGSKGHYMHLVLADRTGQVEGRLWDDAQEAAGWLAPGDIVGVAGRAKLYEGRIRLRIDSLAPTDEDTIDLGEFQPAATVDIGDALATIHAAAARISQQPLSALLASLLGDGDFVSALSVTPPQRPGELLESIVALLELATPLREMAPELDYDLLTASIVLHGIGATVALTHARGGKAVARLGVPALSDQLLAERLAQRPDFPADLAIDLRHCVLSAGDPALARTREAAVLAALRGLHSAVHGKR